MDIEHGFTVPSMARPLSDKQLKEISKQLNKTNNNGRTVNELVREVISENKQQENN
jgi:uncharacterized protein YpuA (DUF1002 family)